MEFTIDELTALVLEHGRLAMQERKLADHHDKLAQIYLEAGKRVRREKEEQESKMNIRKIISGVSVLLLVLMVFSFALSSQPRTLAQDSSATEAATAEATAPVTDETNITVPEQPGGTLVVGWNAISSFIGIIIAAMAAGFLLSLGTIIIVIRQVRQNELIKDFGQKLYMSQPVEVRQKERQIVELGKELVGLADDVTAVDTPVTTTTTTVVG